MKEMVGGCCVCSDERGWPENPLVYCDGQNCTVAVHQACYGIVTVPTGPWFCRKCESQERSARVRCELCPSRDGALKKTDNQGWAHVVCALYIPEVRFGNVTTMEPIILQLIPPERYAKTCYICQDIGKGSRATVGACMQCNRSGCKQQFHVTCAQGLGLLCEEAGNYLDNVKYCGYCQYHYSKLKKGGNVKTIPPYKPITHDSSDGTSSPEKDQEAAASAAASITVNLKGNTGQSGNASTLNSSSSSSTSKQRKSSSNKLTSSSSSSTSNNLSGTVSASSSSVSAASSSASSSTKNNSSSSGSSKEKDKHSKSLNKISSSSKNQDKESSSSSASSSTRDKSKSSKSNKDTVSSDHGSLNTSGLPALNPPTSTLGGAQPMNSKDNITQKFTTHNFTESVVMNADPVFGQSADKLSNASANVLSANQSSSSVTSTRDNKSSSSSSSGGAGSAGKKRKADSSKGSSNSSSNAVGATSTSDTVDISSHPLALRDIIKDVSVTLIPLPMDKTQDVGIGDGGSTDKMSNNKKPKTDLSSTSPRNEINIQNTTPSLLSSQVAGGSLSIKQQAISQTNSSTSGSIQQTSGSNTSSSNSISNTSSQSYIKPPILKDFSESRNRSSSPYNSSATNSSGGSGTPSLYVSVPLSNANVPGVNLPSANADDHIITQTSRSSPLVNHSHHQSNSSLSSQQSIIERQSPRILQNQSLHLTDHSSPNSSAHSSISLHHSSNMSPTLNQRTDPSPMDASGLKITYEKQNLRVAQLQEDQLPARRSRSQSGDSSSKSSRSGKRRSTAGSSSAASSSTSSSNSGVSMPSTSAALPTGSNTEGSETAAAAAAPAPAPAPVPAVQAVPGGSKNSQSHSKHSDSNNISENASSSNSLKNAINNNAASEPVQPSASSSNPTQSTKQMNKKMLRAQQQQQQLQQRHQPTPPPPPLPVSQQQNIAANAQQQPSSSTASITSTTSLIPSEENNRSNSTSSSNSRTPDSVNLSILTSSAVTTISSASGTTSAKDTGGGLKFTYESQIGVAPIGNQSISPNPLLIDPVTKESPPSSPGSEAGSARKRGRKSMETKDNMKMFFHNGVHATHMLGNHLNPASSVAQKMSDQLNSEMEAHSIYTQSGDSGPQLVGVPLPGKAGIRNPNQSSGTHSLSSMLGGNANSVTGNTPQSLEQLLERQWEQGSQFLMEQAQHFDIASLLSCLHQLRTENVRLEEHVNNLIARRDHLLAVNARLAIPLNPAVPPNATLNNLHMNGPTSESVSSRLSRTNPHFNSQQQQQQQQLPVENGIDFRHSSHPPSSNNPSALSRHSSANLNYSSSTSSVHNQQHQQQSQQSALTTSAPMAASSSSSRQQSHLQQQQSALPHSHPQQQQTPSNMVGSNQSSLSAQSSVESHSLVRGSGSSGRSGVNSAPMNSSSINPVAGVGMPSAAVGSGGGGGGSIGSSSYHNATQQSAAYSTIHQSQLRRDDSHGKPS